MGSGFSPKAIGDAGACIQLENSWGLCNFIELQRLHASFFHLKIEITTLNSLNYANF